ncbi:UNVERIFIED_CONTAM: Pre-processing protein 40A [Sesamum angustifolium]|uniref:Pre-processing protein 40A n=1 Tax=Sesamum angustifolium TaxID=2727405 RepID=A0AAW2LW66_9LAMI
MASNPPSSGSQEAKRGIAVAGKINVIQVEEKTTDDEPIIYATKQEAKNAFKALLESANVEADWTWDQAMRVIINDKRYGALKTLGERKQAFNEYLMQRKKVEAEERRIRQRKAKEEFMKMLELVYEDLIDRAKEKEEKEAKKRKRLAKDLTDKLSTIKEINALSTWEECKQLVEDSSEYRSIGEENLCREIFDEYVSRLQEKVKEKERKREEEKAKKEKEREEKEKRKDKERREKEKDKERDKDRDREREKEKGKDHSRKDEEIDDVDGEESHGHNDEKRREKDKERKHRKRHQSTTDDVGSDKDDKEETKKSRKHGSDRKKSRKTVKVGTKKHKKDRDGSRRSGGHEELEDGELGEDGEIQ